jgi:membrane-bound serine protease (ClpP class)
VRGILFVIVLIGAYLEFQHPGLILPGAMALIALAIFLGAPYAAGLATIWTFVAVGLGLALLAVEIFLIPGFGFTGLLGISLILLAVIASFVPAEPGAPPFALPTLQGTWTALRTGLQVMAGSIVTSVIGMILLAQFLPRSRLARGLVLANSRGATYTVHIEPPAVAAVGDIGVVTGSLRPGGQARFGHEIVDVSSQGEYVDAGRRVQVIRREGMNVFVRPLPDEGMGSA